MFFPRVPFGIISLWTAGIHKNSLQAGFSVEPPNCITVVHLQWSGHILFSLRVPSYHIPVSVIAPNIIADFICCADNARDLG